MLFTHRSKLASLSADLRCPARPCSPVMYTPSIHHYKRNASSCGQKNAVLKNNFSTALYKLFSKLLSFTLLRTKKGTPDRSELVCL